MSANFDLCFPLKPEEDQVCVVMKSEPDCALLEIRNQREANPLTRSKSLKHKVFFIG